MAGSREIACSVVGMFRTGFPDRPSLGAEVFTLVLADKCKQPPRLNWLVEIRYSQYSPHLPLTTRRRDL